MQQFSRVVNRHSREYVRRALDEADFNSVVSTGHNLQTSQVDSVPIYDDDIDNDIDYDNQEGKSGKSEEGVEAGKTVEQTEEGKVIIIIIIILFYKA